MFQRKHGIVGWERWKIKQHSTIKDTRYPLKRHKGMFASMKLSTLLTAWQVVILTECAVITCILGKAIWESWIHLCVVTSFNHQWRLKCCIKRWRHSWKSMFTQLSRWVAHAVLQYIHIFDLKKGFNPLSEQKIISCSCSFYFEGILVFIEFSFKVAQNSFQHFFFFFNYHSLSIYATVMY